MFNRTSTSASVRNVTRSGVILLIGLLALAGTGTASAQAGATLIGYAALPAGALTDGEPSASAFSGAVNGVSTPLTNQPFGSIVGIGRSQFSGKWQVLTSGQFDSSANSADFQLRLYTVEFDSGDIVINNWITLTDNGASLTGAQVNPVGFVRLADDSIWVADAATSSLLQFSVKGRAAKTGTLRATVPIAAQAGSLGGITVLPDGDTLIVAVNGGGGAQLLPYRVSQGAFGAPLGTINTTGGAQVTGITAINASQLLVIESDSGAGAAAQIKRVGSVPLTGGPPSPLIDLLNIANPNGLAGAAGVFTFPYASIRAVYPRTDSSLIVINNNQGMFSTARQSEVADPTEYIEVQIGTSLTLDPALTQ